MNSHMVYLSHSCMTNNWIVSFRRIINMELDYQKTIKDNVIAPYKYSWKIINPFILVTHVKKVDAHGVFLSFSHFYLTFKTKNTLQQFAIYFKTCYHFWNTRIRLLLPNSCLGGSIPSASNGDNCNFVQFGLSWLMEKDC